MTKCTSIHCPRATCYMSRANSEYFEYEDDFYKICNENSGYPNHISIKMKKNNKIIKANR